MYIDTIKEYIIHSIELTLYDINETTAINWHYL